MVFLVYKITNNVNGKIYIGKHQTKDLDDGYMGSGKLLKRALGKHGIENFTKDILFQFDNEEDMNAKEAELVSNEFVKENTNYNLCPGGNGGFGYINENSLNSNLTPKPKDVIISTNKAMVEGLRYKLLDSDYKSYHISKAILNLKPGSFKNKKHKPSSKTSIGLKNSFHQKGSKNSQFGTMWITDGINNKKIKNTDSIPEGWYRGRK